MKNIPNYKRIYSDLIHKKFPEKSHLLPLLSKRGRLTALEIIHIDFQLASQNTKDHADQKFRSYDKNSIFEILDHQKRNNLSNTDIAREFGMSRNTISKWKKLFIAKIK